MFSRIKYIVLVFCLGLFLMISTRLLFTHSRTPKTIASSSDHPLRFVHDDIGTTPVGVGEKVRVLCYTTNTSGTPVADLLLTISTNGLSDHLTTEECPYVAALHLLHEQPSGKPMHGPAYNVYATSWEHGTTLLSEASEDIVIHDDEKLVLFNVVAGLEWEPSPGSLFVSELLGGLEQASAYLYDLSDGQMAIGPVEIYTNGRFWNDADFQFRAANDYRPSAYVGGIVSERTPFVTGGLFSSTVYAPGSVLLGRHWDGNNAYDETNGSWLNEEGFRTIVHEFGHYALFLYDEYINAAGEATHCTGLENRNQNTETTNASVMDYHYSTSEFWHVGEHGIPTPCRNTVQHQVHGRSDWDTLTRWYEIQDVTTLGTGLNQPVSLLEYPPLGITADLFDRTPGHTIHLPIIFSNNGTSVAVLDDLDVFLDIDTIIKNTETLPTQVYILEGGNTNPTRIIYQGHSFIGSNAPAQFPGDMSLLGVGTEDQPRIHLDRYAVGDVEGKRYTFPPVGVTSISLADGQVLNATPDQWEASLDATYALSRSNLTTMTLTLTGPTLGEPEVQLCVPDTAVGCPAAWQANFMALPNLTWQAVFTPLQGFSELPSYGVIRVRNENNGEMIRWFLEAGGVGPSHIGADAPLRDGLVMVDTVDNIPGSGECNRVVIMPAADYEALKKPLDENNIGIIHGVIGGPFDIDILLPNPGGTCPGLIPGDHILPASVTLTFFYDQATIDRLGINENELTILNFDRTIQNEGVWTPITVADRSSELNWLSTVPVNRDGIYAIVWIPGG